MQVRVNLDLNKSYFGLHAAPLQVKRPNPDNRHSLSKVYRYPNALWNSLWKDRYAMFI